MMGEVALWEQIVVGIGAAFLLFWLWPGVKAALAESEKVEKDWKGLVIPLVLVVLFVVLLIAAV